MSERLLSPAAYIIVLVVLMLSDHPDGRPVVRSQFGLMRIVAGQAIAVVKASLVVLFFMHALRSPAPDAGRDRRDRLLVRRRVGGIDLQRLLHAGNDPQPAGTLACLNSGVKHGPFSQASRSARRRRIGVADIGLNGSDTLHLARPQHSAKRPWAVVRRGGFVFGRLRRMGEPPLVALWRRRVCFDAGHERGDCANGGGLLIEPSPCRHGARNPRPALRPAPGGPFSVILSVAKNLHRSGAGSFFSLFGAEK